MVESITLIWCPLSFSKPDPSKLRPRIHLVNSWFSTQKLICARYFTFAEIGIVTDDWLCLGKIVAKTKTSIITTTSGTDMALTRITYGIALQIFWWIMLIMYFSLSLVFKRSKTRSGWYWCFFSSSSSQQCLLQRYSWWIWSFLCSCQQNWQNT